jgi:hypothetical protein
MFRYISRGSRSLILRVSTGYWIQLCCTHSSFYEPVPTTYTTPHRPWIVRYDAVQGRVSCIVRVRSIVVYSRVGQTIEHKKRGVTNHGLPRRWRTRVNYNPTGVRQLYSRNSLGNMALNASSGNVIADEQDVKAIGSQWSWGTGRLGLTTYWKGTTFDAVRDALPDMLCVLGGDESTADQEQDQDPCSWLCSLL